MARIALEPIGEELDCGEEETILDAAFRQGWSLAHGCREGQCSACKAYLLEGEVTLKPYSTFALSESEEEQGYTLLCRAMPDEDLTVELLHFDEDNLRLDVPITDGRARVTRREDVTRDITRLELEVLEPEGFTFRHGQYVDLHVPGSEDERRSFSMANLPGDDGPQQLELLIKRYPGGRISGLLEEGGLEPGTELGFTGPYGTFGLRDGEGPVLMVAGGSGMAPQLALLRELVRLGSTREVRFFYGARTEDDLFDLELVEQLGSQLADFRFVPVLSDQRWDGATGFVHDVADAHLKEQGAGDDLGAYLCGPPPMVDAALEVLVDVHGIDESRIHYDKFTTTAAADGAAA